MTGGNRENWGLNAPRDKSLEHWEAEQEVIGPGLQAVMLWSTMCVETAEGAVLTDLDGNRVLDFQGAGGVNSIGHANPHFVSALSAQVAVSPAGAFGSHARREMAQAVRDFLPEPLDRIQLYSGGTEAVEAALRLAKSVTGKYEFLSFWGGFHGKSLGSLALTAGARAGLGPLPSGHFSAPYANCYRCPLKLKPDSCGLACVDQAREVIKQNSTGALAALVVEPVQGRSGNVVPPPGYLQALGEVAKEFDALLIVDEMMTGFGRTGAAFAFQHDGVVPDIVTVGKGMGGGYPVTGVISTAQHMSARPFSDPSASSSSFGAFPMACRAVATVIDVLVEENLVDHTEQLGAELLEALRPLVDEAPLVGDVRGIGLAIGIELVSDKTTREPVSGEVLRETFLALLKAGVLVMTGGNTLRLYPPLNIGRDQALEAVEIIRRTLIGGVA
ncbi:4-aminobutyrate aminotransferase/4-aminobutyrate aminotransferase / (S)-3-amino-2-methylpropionate transaminase [Streptosporangium subroseum]|uniref:4-aminobutyrate aminotransferase/4-aminobutyrate aminotransferase / (S)-3-amino-2-methylpropionate transaminase n=1 Tax=Streptosporangium subroseum TaxID=106412 RepID=A0A239G1M3_9ACTN|nr:aspartate aminotransferase family protein [Streptosporangium subroseum]SNS62373.1 4-aminobutyrate aminotransferase/4-aminobutyrate aminotransferase / (S)-3-amino-2-methylpropionate transaminase [Streptosporangium subroseum]